MENNHPYTHIILKSQQLGPLKLNCYAAIGFNTTKGEKNMIYMLASLI